MVDVDWKPMEDMPEEGTFLVLLAEEHKLMGSRISIMRNHPNVQFINGMFAYDMPKPLLWDYLPEEPKT